MSLFKRKDSPYWWVKISVAGSKPIQRSTGSTNREQAAEYEAKLANSLWEQKRLGVKPRYLWQEAVLRHIDESFEKKSHKTQIYHFKWLSPHLDGKYIDEISRTLIDSLAAIRKKENVSNATVNRYIQAISTVLRKAAHEWEWLDRAPKFRKLPEPLKRIRWLTKEQANILLEELPIHLEAMVRFSLATGLRQSNVYKLQWSHVDLGRKQAWVDAEQSKNGNAIAVPLSSEAMAVLAGEFGKHSTHVFTYRGKPVSEVKGKAWRGALVRAGISNFRWHDLRHTWASWHIQNGTPLMVLKELGGWSDFEMVQKYAHLSSSHLAQYVERVSVLGVAEKINDLATI